MLRKAIFVLALAATAVLSALPAHAMCTAGRLEVRGGRVIFEPPHCQPFE